VREVQGERRRATKEEARRSFEERRSTQYLPEAGEKRPQALRTYSPARAPSTQVTADVAAYAYPFLAEAGLGSQGILVGADAWSGAAFVFDPWVLYEGNMLTNANMLVAGVIGRGKSALVKSLVTRSITVGRRCYVACDPKGEWTAVSRAVGGQAIVLGVGSSHRLNPLDAPPRPSGVDDVAWHSLKALVETALGRGLHAVEITALDVALDTAVKQMPQPLLGRVVAELLSPLEGIVGATCDELATDGRDVGHALRRLVDGDLKGLFDGPSTVNFDPSLPMVSIDMSGVSGSDTALAMVSACGAAWIESALCDPSGGRRYVVYDEAWRLLRSPALLARMQSDWKLSRARGISNVMVIHRLSDLDAVGDGDSEARALALGLLADCSVKVIYAQERGEATQTGRRLGLSDVEIEELPGLGRGQGLWRVGERSFLVNHRLTEGELAMFDTNQRMVER
jgi:type IV secretory pathway VirB4 component